MSAKIIVTQWDNDGNAIVTEAEAFTEAYPGQIEDMVAGIKGGLSARDALAVYKHPIPDQHSESDSHQTIVRWIASFAMIDKIKQWIACHWSHPRRHEWVWEGGPFPVCRHCGTSCWWIDGYLCSNGTYLWPDDAAKAVLPDGWEHPHGIQRGYTTASQDGGV